MFVVEFISHNVTWCVFCIYFPNRSQSVQIGPNRFRGFSNLTKHSQIVLNLIQTPSTHTHHFTRTHWKSSCLLETTENYLCVHKSVETKNCLCDHALKQQEIVVYAQISNNRELFVCVRKLVVAKHWCALSSSKIVASTG